MNAARRPPRALRLFAALVWLALGAVLAAIASPGGLRTLGGLLVTSGWLALALTLHAYGRASQLAAQHGEADVGPEPR